MEDLEKKVRGKVSAAIVDLTGCEPEEVVDNASLGVDLLMDSLDKVEFMMKLDDIFSITVEDDEAEGIETYGQVVELIMKKVSE